MASGREIHIDDLPPELHADPLQPDAALDWDTQLRTSVSQALARGERAVLQELLPCFERAVIESALLHTAGKRREAAELLGWGRNTLTRKIKELGLAD